MSAFFLVLLIAGMFARKTLEERLTRLLILHHLRRFVFFSVGMVIRNGFDQRTALLLCREGGVSYEEIADVMGGISLTAVKSIIFRGRSVLKSRLKPYLKSGEWQKK